MSPELRNIRERLEKSVLLVPAETVSIYQQQRDDIRALLGIIDMQEKQIAALVPREVA